MSRIPQLSSLTLIKHVIRENCTRGLKLHILRVFKAQTLAIVGQIVEQCLDPLVEGIDPSFCRSDVDVRKM